MEHVIKMNENDIIVIKCPACSGYHAISGHDQIDYICQGSAVVRPTQKKMYQDIPDADGSKLTEDDWNNRRFDTKIDERRETTVIGAEISKERGRIYKDSEDTWR